MNFRLLNNWYNSDALRQLDFPDLVRQWLSSSGSMTLAMREVTENQLDIKLLSSGMQMISEQEAQLLGIDSDSEVFTREVLMQQEGESLLYGRSIFPSTVPEHAMQVIRELGNEPLGEVLFQANEQPRLSMQYAMVDGDMYLYESLERYLPQTEPLYARRSLFCYHNELVLVQEIFLTEHPINALVKSE